MSGSPELPPSPDAFKLARFELGRLRPAQAPGQGGGVGIFLQHAENVTITDSEISGFAEAIHAENVRGLDMQRNKLEAPVDPIVQLRQIIDDVEVIAQGGRPANGLPRKRLVKDVLDRLLALGEDKVRTYLPSIIEILRWYIQTH
jgi:hypothetical protein